MALWLGAVGVLCWALSLTSRYEGKFPTSRAWIARAVVETVLCAAHAGVLGAYAVLCMKERKKLVGAGLKWYQLGEYGVQ